jgi:hypothetical protein
MAGGGKGGIGESFVSANLAAALAAAGRRCVAIDADLGGANLHTLLGVSRPRDSLSHLLAVDVPSLADLMVQTPVPKLWLRSPRPGVSKPPESKLTSRSMPPGISSPDPACRISVPRDATNAAPSGRTEMRKWIQIALLLLVAEAATGAVQDKAQQLPGLLLAW